MTVSEDNPSAAAKPDIAAAEETINLHVGSAVTLALIPVPLFNLVAISGVQLNMIRKLALLYGCPFDEHLGRSILAALAGGGLGFGAGALAASMVHIVPGVGTVLSLATLPGIVGASTYAVGKTVLTHFQAGGTLATLNTSAIKAQYKAEFEAGQEIAERMRRRMS